MRKLEMHELPRKSIADFHAAEKRPLIGILDNIRSMHNVGSIFRTADAFLLQALFLCGFTPRPPHRDINKTALGATETVQWQYFENALDAIQLLKQQGYAIFAVEQVEHSIPLHHFQHPGPVAVIFGNELNGVDEKLLSHCDGSIEIPQAGMKHSLNVSIAAGIVFWELVRTKIDQ